MNLRQIEVFRAVITTGSITDAARSLHVSQPGISRLIRHLELRLHITLFERRKGRLLPTPEARALHAEIERVYRGVLHVQEFAAGLHAGRRTTLRVLSSANTALQLVPRAIASIVAKRPESKVHFEMLPTREIVKLLLSEEADVAVSSAPLDHPSLDVRAIGHWSLVCALAHGHRFATAKVLPLEDVLRERLIVYSPEAPQSEALSNWLGRYGIEADVAVEVRSGFAACSMAAAGIGVAFVDDLSARAHRPDGLVFKAIPRSPQYPVYTVVNTNRPLSQLGKAFLGGVQAQLRILQRTGLHAEPLG